MIKYVKLATGTPPDVEMITDDSNAEMAALEEMIAETEFEDIELPSERGDDGDFHITIPGESVGEFSECVWGIDGGVLDGLTEQWNQEVLDAAADDED